MPEFLMHIVLFFTDMLSLIGFRDLVQNQLTGDIPRLIYRDEVLQYLGLRGNSLTENVDALRNKATAMKSNPIGATADFDEDGKMNLSSWKEQSRDGSLNSC
ncbi:hypothetical protein MKW98_015528 [Papaver atlanticum]|uniref:Uncharacterized protein n=1 Tax=Papaver atlanticum TaxID=357466 RepID=A0AAD4S4R8_9MAGN|nr:hypothetical protein MKW98_015528 [Papaver atlanticum]